MISVDTHVCLCVDSANRDDRVPSGLTDETADK